MRDDPFYALISGFDPEDTPGVGTFYDFQDRLLQRARQSRTTHCHPRRRRDQRDTADHHKDKNDLRPQRYRQPPGRPHLGPRLPTSLLGCPLGSKSCNLSSSPALSPTRPNWTSLISTISTSLVMAANYPPGPIPTARSSALATTGARSQKTAAPAIAPIVTPGLSGAGTATGSAGSMATASTNSPPTAFAIAANCPWSSQ